MEKNIQRTKAQLARVRDYAKLLFVKEKLTQKEIAQKVGVSEQTISKWVNNEKWDELRTITATTRENRYRDSLNYLTALDNAIKSRDEKERFPTKEELLKRKNLIADIKALETELNLTNVIHVFQKFLDWIRPIDCEKGKEICNLFDAYIKDQLK